MVIMVVKYSFKWVIVVFIFFTLRQIQYQYLANICTLTTEFCLKIDEKR